MATVVVEFLDRSTQRIENAEMNVPDDVARVIVVCVYDKSNLEKTYVFPIHIVRSVREDQ